MSSRLLATAFVGLFFAALATGCSKPNGSISATSVSGIRVTVSSLRMERTEDHQDALKRTRVTFNTKATIEVTDGKGGTPSGFLTLNIADETGAVSGHNLPESDLILIDNGKAELEKSFSKNVPDGQALPSPPKYSISAAAFVPIERGELVTGGQSSPDALKNKIPSFQIIAAPSTVYEEDASYYDRSIVRIKALGNAPKDPLFMILKAKTLRHVKPENVGKEVVATIVVIDGEGSLSFSEFLDLNWGYEGSVRVDKPAPTITSDRKYSLVGFYRMQSVALETQ